MKDVSNIRQIQVLTLFLYCKSLTVVVLKIYWPFNQVFFCNSCRVKSIWTARPKSSAYFQSFNCSDLRCSQAAFASSIIENRSTGTRRYHWSPRADLNRWPLPYHGSALPLSYMGKGLRSAVTTWSYCSRERKSCRALAAGFVSDLYCIHQD